MSLYCVEIRAFNGDGLVKRTKFMPYSRADRVENGMMINLDHANYYTVMVSEDDVRSGGKEKE